MMLKKSIVDTLNSKFLIFFYHREQGGHKKIKKKSLCPM